MGCRFKILQRYILVNAFQKVRITQVHAYELEVESSRHRNALGDYKADLIEA